MSGTIQRYTVTPKGQVVTTEFSPLMKVSDHEAEVARLRESAVTVKPLVFEKRHSTWTAMVPGGTYDVSEGAPGQSYWSSPHVLFF